MTERYGPGPDCRFGCVQITHSRNGSTSVLGRGRESTEGPFEEIVWEFDAKGNSRVVKVELQKLRREYDLNCE